MKDPQTQLPMLGPPWTLCELGYPSPALTAWQVLIYINACCVCVFYHHLTVWKVPLGRTG